MRLFKKIVLIVIFLLFIPFVYAQNCIDHDNGLDWYTSSNVTFYGLDYLDRCVNSKILIEGRCDENENIILTSHDCSPSTCENGKCFQITTTTTSTITTTTMTIIPILTVESRVDITGNYISNMPIEVDSNRKLTDDGIVTYPLSPGVHSIEAFDYNSREFSHFWDQDCDGNGNWKDVTKPYNFMMYGNDRSITALYKVFTKIVDLKYDGTKITGQLLDEEDYSIIGAGCYHNSCSNPDSCEKIIYPNRDVKLYYYNDSWKSIDSVDSSIDEGSFSYNWVCTGGTTKIKAEYIPSGDNWYYSSSMIEIPVSCVIATTTTTTIRSTSTTTTSPTTTTSTTTTSTSTTVRSTSTTTTTSETTTTSLGETTTITTTSLPTSPSMTIQSSEKYDSCPNNAYTINCNQIIRREVNPGEAYDAKDYFKFTLDKRMKVKIYLSSEYDYDLYVKWDGLCPDVAGPYSNGKSYYCHYDCTCDENGVCTGYCKDSCEYDDIVKYYAGCSKQDCCNKRIGTYDCGPCSDNIDEYNNMNEFCPEEDEKTLEPGTYYFLVYNYVGDAPYDVTLVCSDVSQVTTTTTTTEGATTTTVSVQTTTTSISGSTTTMTTLEGATTTTTTVESTTTTIKEGRGGGCPILEAFNGKEFIKIEKLNIHSPKDHDLTYTSRFTMQPINGKYELILHEASYLFWDGSHIDSVKLTDESGKECRLLSAVHSKDGDVLSAIEKSDDVRVRNFPGDEIRLTYDGCSGNTFTFNIEGYNIKWMLEDVTTMVPIAIVIVLLVSAIIIGILKVTKSKSAEPAPQYDEESSEEPFY
jgi:hypothetical protein